MKMRIIAAICMSIGIAGSVVAQDQKIVAKQVDLDRLSDEVAIETYSRMTGAPSSTAKADLARQALAQEEIDWIRKEFKERIAEVYWDDYPHQSVRVLLSGSEKVPPRVISTAAGPVSVVFQEGAKESAEARLQRQRELIRRLSLMVPGVVGGYLDARTGVLHADVESQDGERTAVEAEMSSIEQALGVKVEISFGRPASKEAGPVSRPTDDRHRADSSLRSITALPGVIPGGWKLLSVSTGLYCTGGFTVHQIASGKTGIVTAGHCPDTLVYQDYPVPPSLIPSVILPTTLEGRFWGGEYDLQWHSFDGGLNANAVFCKNTQDCGEVVILKIPKPSIGTVACHMGATTGSSCGVVVSNEWTYAGTSTCNNPDQTTCPSGEWLRIEGPNLLCAGGDSGGPVFRGSTAYGLLKAAWDNQPSIGECGGIVVMPINRVTAKGFLIL